MRALVSRVEFSLGAANLKFGFWFQQIPLTSGTTRKLNKLIKTRPSHGFHNTYAIGPFILLLDNRLGSVARLTRTEDLVIKRIDKKWCRPESRILVPFITNI